MALKKVKLGDLIYGSKQSRKNFGRRTEYHEQHLRLVVGDGAFAFFRRNPRNARHETSFKQIRTEGGLI